MYRENLFGQYTRVSLWDLLRKTNNLVLTGKTVEKKKRKERKKTRDELFLISNF